MNLINWLFGSHGYMAPYLTNEDRRILYDRRKADYTGSNPEDYRQRYLEGLAIQARLHRPKAVKPGANVTPLRKRKV